MKSRTTRYGSLFALLAALLAVLGLSGTALAQDGAGGLHGQIQVRAETGHRPVEMTEQGGEFAGSFTMENVGDAPLKVTRVALRDGPSDPRLPPGVSVEIEGGGTGVTIKPGDKVKATVRWKTAGVKARELYGQVLIESDSLAPGAEEPGRPAAIGVHAERGYGLGFIGDHILSLLTFLPLLGLIAIFIAHIVGYSDDKKLRTLTVIIQGVNLVLACWLYWKFDTSFT